MRLVEGLDRISDTGENLARNRVWGSQFTAGSRAIRESNEYVRKAGATARTMLIAGRRQRVEGAGIGVQRHRTA